MRNVFQKCLRREFGEKGYLRYVTMCREEIAGQDPARLNYENKAIYQDMYQNLSEENQERLREKVDKLMETMYHAFQIGRRFWSVFLFYLTANIVMLCLSLDYIITCISLALMGVCFLYKLIEFVSNKYCFIDAYLVMVYKAVLEKLYTPAVKS